MILAKSDGTTLKDHIRDCLRIVDNLHQSLPELSSASGMVRFWEQLFYSVCFHDLGKVHKEFQKVLKGQRDEWTHQRHEVYSVAYVDKLKIDIRERDIIRKVILAHHKTFEELRQRYKNSDEIKNDLELIYSERAYHPEDFHANLMRCFPSSDLREIFTFLGQLAHSRGIPLDLKGILYKDIIHPVEELVFNRSAESEKESSFWGEMLLWGALKICDHYASAGIREIYRLKEEHFSFLTKMQKELQQKGDGFHTHQKLCFEKDGNTILIAPTGSGKTEAAIGWLRRQHRKAEGRIYYVLPYTASINAMHQRLVYSMEGDISPIGSTAVGVQHGKLSQYLQHLWEDEHVYMLSDDRREQLLRQYRSMILPVKVVTPFQLLKYLYGVKGYEMGYAELAGAKIILDEIHAYDVLTFAQLLVMFEYLSKYLKVNFLVMSATIPSFMLNYLKSTLNVSGVIRADRALCDSLKRHRVEVCDGSVFDQFDRLSELLSSNRRGILVCNTVAKAQECFRKIVHQELVSADEIVVLHGRFTTQDRLAKEESVSKKKTRLLIGTQAIEVSLDIDYDFMITEPAPLDALLQRFGRVNRRSRQSTPAPILVCRKGGEFDGRIYPESVTSRTIDVLESQGVIRESDIQSLLDLVYPEWEEHDRQEFENTLRLFRVAVGNLKPFSRHKENEEEFYDKFDGIEILPSQFLPDYKHALEKWDFIHAEQYKVSIRKGMYTKYIREGIIHAEPITILKKDEAVFETTVLLIDLKYNSNVGLTDDPL
ncbi:MAG TPA: CRISPR-associated helicase Cas3', partial [Deltaproteobacteria bacterium]|nr:CRISPR-associated helicase Cas3' [Deltaproteobacteria bacterium]